MEKNIIFRSWNETDDCFYYFINGFYYSDLDAWHIEVDKHCFKWDKAEQFTGLLDRKGNKIFENDKIKFTVRRDYLGKNRPCNVTFRSNVVFKDATFLISETSENDTPLCGFNQECEIIGNIHDSND